MRIEELKQYIDQRFRDLDEKNAIQKSALSGKIEAGFDLISLKQQEIINHLERTNGNVEKNQVSIDKLSCQTRFIRWFARNPSFGIPLLIVLLLGVVFIISYFGFGSLFKLI